MTDEQVDRLHQLLSTAAIKNHANAAIAERDLEKYSYRPGPDYDPRVRQQKLETYNECDFNAESASLMLQLLRKEYPRLVR